MKLLTKLIASLFLCCNAALAQNAPLSIGDNAAELIQATDSLGREARFESLKETGGLILIFTRSADWCQYCIGQLKDWNNHVDAVREAGYGLAALSYDSVGTLAKFEKANDLRYMLLSDTQSRVIDAFGIRNTRFDEGSRFYGIPNPAIYVLDANGVITHIFKEEGYKERPQPADVIGAITQPQESGDE